MKISKQLCSLSYPVHTYVEQYKSYSTRNYAILCRPEFVSRNKSHACQEFLHYAWDTFDIYYLPKRHGGKKISRLSHTSPIFYAKEVCIYEAHYVDQVSVDLGGPDTKNNSRTSFSFTHIDIITCDPH